MNPAHTIHGVTSTVRALFTVAVIGLTLVSARRSEAGLFFQPNADDLWFSAGSQPGDFNTVAVLVGNVSGFGDPGPNPGGGGGGTSWAAVGNAAGKYIGIDFDFPIELLAMQLWDYYGHSPTQYNLKLYDATGFGGNQLLDVNFSIPAADYNPQVHFVEFADTPAVRSAQLTALNNSQWGYFGMAEIAFHVPEPSTAALLGAGLAGLLLRPRKT
jgi:hypothetical protein